MSAKDPTEAAVLVLLELKDAICEGRALLKDITAERKAVQAMLAGIPRQVETETSKLIAAEMEKLGEATRVAMDAAVVRVNASFDRLADILHGVDKKSVRNGRPGLEELLRSTVEAYGPILSRQANT